jgi:hypothetical protein
VRKPSQSQLLLAASQDLFDRLERSLPSADEDDERACDAFLDAEGLIDAYLDSVASGSTELPAASDLALACAHVLVATQALTQDDLTTLTRLNAPGLGGHRYTKCPQVANMKERALTALKAMATAPPPATPQTPDLGDPVF